MVGCSHQEGDDLDGREPDQATDPGRRRAARGGPDHRGCQDHQDNGGEQVGALVVHPLGFEVLRQAVAQEPPEDGAEGGRAGGDHDPQVAAGEADGRQEQANGLDWRAADSH